MRAIHKIAIVGTTVVALVGVGLGGAAQADPASTPSLTTLVGVGSDTITPLFAGSPTENTSPSIVTDYNNTSPTFPIGSWDAVNPSNGVAGQTITLKASGSSDTSCQAARPDGSSAGITALNNNQQDATEVKGQPVYCIDYARSSRAPNTTSFKDAFDVFATDAITWSVPTGVGTNPQPSTLTKTDLFNIYTCKDINWDQTTTPGTNAPIVAVLPQNGSGTRSTFLTYLGITASSEPCWINGVDPLNSNNVIEENTGLSAGNADTFEQTTKVLPSYNGTTEVPNSASSADVIFPYSIGDWIAQGTAVKGNGQSGTPCGATVGGHASSIWAHGPAAPATNGEMALQDMTLGTTTTAPTSINSCNQPVINPNFDSQLYRNLYVVVRNGFSNPTNALDAAWPTTPSYDSTGLQAAFGPSGWLCTNNVAKSDIVSFGFIATCGSLTAGD